MGFYGLGRIGSGCELRALRKNCVGQQLGGKMYGDPPRMPPLWLHLSNFAAAKGAVVERDQGKLEQPSGSCPHVHGWPLRGRRDKYPPEMAGETNDLWGSMGLGGWGVGVS